MSLKKGFLRQTDIRFPRAIIINSIIFWIVYSFTFYAFFWFSREIFRLITILGWPNNLFVLTDQEVRFYNLFFAFLSTIISLQIAIRYLFENSISLFNHKAALKQRQIINEQGFHTWYFLSWFSKIGVVVGMVYVSWPIQLHLQLFPDYLYLAILLIFVLYSISWLGIVRTFKIKSYKYILFGFLIIAIVSYSLSCINFGDYKKINHDFLSNTIHYNYRISLPESSIYKIIERRSLTIDAYYGFSKKENGQEPQLIVKDYNKSMEEITLDQLPYYIYRELDKMSEPERYKAILFLHIDSAIEYQYIRRLNHYLSRNVNIRLYYDVLTTEDEFPQEYQLYDNRGFPDRLPYFCRDLDNKIDSLLNLKSMPDKIPFITKNCYRYSMLKEFAVLKVGIDADNHLMINDKIRDPDALFHLVKSFFKKFHGYGLIYLEISDQAEFAKYIKTKELILKAVYELRTEMARIRYDRTYFAPWEIEYEFKRNDWEMYSFVERYYPVNVFEPTLTERRLYNHIQKNRKNKD